MCFSYYNTMFGVRFKDYGKVQWDVSEYEKFAKICY